MYAFMYTQIDTFDLTDSAPYWPFRLWEHDNFSGTLEQDILQDFQLGGV
jgi:hypothetical protein